MAPRNNRGADAPVPYALVPATRLADFDASAERLRGDLRACGWTRSPSAVERWVSRDMKHTLTLAAAWELARKDEASLYDAPPLGPEASPPPRPSPVVVRDPDYCDRGPPDFDQRSSNDDEASPQRALHGGNVAPDARGRKVTGR